MPISVMNDIHTSIIDDLCFKQHGRYIIYHSIDFFHIALF